ncbi:hypothetical protein PR048_005018 [Dryococelus australis]|uniref:Uncharacterized protein n=1 Tax=Dryococelus australis TaxID=614101 RepID=A0ABQ9I714_9NEOP|nr:hypothetical protein PR048_005018 [Dryococelus australis]
MEQRSNARGVGTGSTPMTPPATFVRNYIPSDLVGNRTRLALAKGYTRSTETIYELASVQTKSTDFVKLWKPKSGWPDRDSNPGCPLYASINLTQISARQNFTEVWRPDAELTCATVAPRRVQSSSGGESVRWPSRTNMDTCADTPPLINSDVVARATCRNKQASTFPYSEVTIGSIPGQITLRFLACGNRAGRCRWSAGFLGDLPFPRPFIPALLHTSFTLIGSHDLAVRSCLHLFMHSLFVLDVNTSRSALTHSRLHLPGFTPSRPLTPRTPCPQSYRTSLRSRN